MNRRSRLKTILVTLALGLLYALPAGAQPFGFSGSFPFEPICPPTGARVVVEIEQRLDEVITPMQTIPGGPPTETLVQAPGTPWRPVAGLGATDPNAQQGRVRQLHYVALASELGPLIQGTEGSSVLRSVSPGFWYQPGVLVSTWLWQDGEARLRDFWAFWNGGGTRYLYTDDFPGSPAYAPTVLISGTVRNRANLPYRESVFLYCVSAAQYARPPLMTPDETTSTDGARGPWDVYVWRDWCGRWTCANRWYADRRH